MKKSNNRGKIVIEVDMKNVLFGKNPAAVAMGKIKNEKRAKASRENGEKGGRPKKK